MLTAFISIFTVKLSTFQDSLVAIRLILINQYKNLELPRQFFEKPLETLKIAEVL